MSAGFGDLRKGMAIELDGKPYEVIDYQRQKMQQRAPTYHIKLRNLVTGHQVDKTFSGYGIKLTRAPVENRTAATMVWRRAACTLKLGPTRRRA